MDDQRKLEYLIQYIEAVNRKSDEPRRIPINLTAEKLAKLIGYRRHGNDKLPTEFFYRGHYLVPTGKG